MRGRLSEAACGADLKHPILFLARHPAVFLPLRQMHEGNHHEGTEYVRGLVQQQFWVIGPRNGLRNIEFQCVRCSKLAEQPSHRHVADLLKKREDGFVYPFKGSAVECFGPIEVTIMRGTGEHWYCLFTYLVTRAVHIEVVNGLDTDACMVANTGLRARRGRSHRSSVIVEETL